ncbi:MAG: tRNA pseudouridine(55) synthase TruB [Gammaproteobacteria bacterium]|nr:tRNA pseudouridine(55) synthase TruB [Gammaproteobacteria bacterium]
MNGILILDKPVGMSSNQALQRVKKILGVKKAGHTGALDVLASGLLPICVGEATKFSQFLLEADKYYRVTAYLGKRTTTCDSEGAVIETRSISDITEEKLDHVLAQFRGEIWQVPSMFSALKHKGQPLYKLARKGIEIEREPRKVTIFELKKIKWAGHELTLEVRCSKGTYIRNLIDDIGKALGCGAYVLSLRRLEAGPYKSDQMITIDALSISPSKIGARYLLPIPSMFPQIPTVVVSAQDAQALRQGRCNFWCQTPKVTSKLVQLVEESGQFFGIGELFPDGILKPKRLTSSTCATNGV